jgi:hypothetical protein
VPIIRDEADDVRQIQGSRRDRRATSDSAKELVVASALNAGDADDFPAPDVEGCIAHSDRSASVYDRDLVRRNGDGAGRNWGEWWC